MLRLGVNVDHVATLRQARQESFPSPVWAALEAERAGCHSIVCHLREDRRHIQDRDVAELKRRLKIPLNLEMGASPEIVRIAARVKPYQATLVPERRQELTTEGGLDVKKGQRRLRLAITRLRSAGIHASLFIDPEPAQIIWARRVGAPMIELHTGRYAGAKTAVQRRQCLNAIDKGARLAHALGLEVAAGHGLDYHNTTPVAKIPEIEELNIGFSIVAQSVEVGLHRAVRQMLKLCRRGKR